MTDRYPVAPDRVNGHLISSREFSQSQRDEILTRTRGLLARALSSEERPGEIFDVDGSATYGSIIIQDVEDPTGATDLGVRISSFGSFIMYSSAYDGTSDERPKILVEANPPGILVAEYRTNLSEPVLPIDESQAVSLINRALSQVEARFEPLA